jgi:hypothetical protein
LDKQELELEEILEKFSEEFRVIFEAQLEAAKPKKIETGGPKKSSLKKSKSEESPINENEKSDNIKSVR